MLQEFDFKYIHIKGEDNVVVADAFSRLCDHHPMDGVAKTERLFALFISSDSVGSNAPTTIEPRSNSNSAIPVTTEPSIDPILKSKIEAVHNSVARHFGVEYTRVVYRSWRGKRES